MGVDYLIINPSKRQFLDPIDFGESTRWIGLLRGHYCLEALKYLISASHIQHGSELWQRKGTWVGDAIVVAGDDSSPPNPAGITTATEDNPKRNLYFLAVEEFYNISHLALVMLAESGRGETAAEIVADAETDDRLFATIADVLMQAQPPRLKRAFDAQFGYSWKDRYEDYVKRRPSHQPLPVLFET